MSLTAFSKRYERARELSKRPLLSYSIVTRMSMFKLIDVNKTRLIQFHVE